MSLSIFLEWDMGLQSWKACFNIQLMANVSIFSAKYPRYECHAVCCFLSTVSSHCLNWLQMSPVLCMVFICSGCWSRPFISRLVRKYKLSYKPWAKSMEEGDFRPFTAPRPLDRFSWNLKYITGRDPSCKVLGATSTWVVWQIASLVS